MDSWSLGLASICFLISACGGFVYLVLVWGLSSEIFKAKFISEIFKMNYWLVKSEPYVFSIHDLKRDKTTLWDGVRNYQARNFLKEMKKGDLVLYYHSNEDPIGVAGLATAHKEAYPDTSQFDKKSKYFDSKASEENPRWFCPDLKFKKAFKSILPLATLRETKGLEDMLLLRKGSRLSVQPVDKKHFERVVKLAEG